MNTPTTEPAKRLAALFNRKLTTSWSDKEVKAYKQLVKDGLFTDLSDLALVERYHNAQKKLGHRGFHRRDLQTLLNHFRGELDRAREWSFKEKRPRKVVHSSNGSGQLSTATDEEFKRAGEVAKQVFGDLRARFRQVTPDGWQEWIEKNHATAQEKDFWRVSDDVRKEFSEERV